MGRRVGAMAVAGAGGRAAEEAVTLDPYRCIVKRNRKYASECTEVYLAKEGGEVLSENFAHFTNLEVVWFSGNRLSRLENLEACFRIREVYVEDNRLVSLSGLKNLKFLRVLLASNNQLRNLEKQLALLSRFAFLKKLDLFGNPVSEEPDYRLRMIYHVPQVEILDQHTVKGPERLKADAVVPHLDKVSATKVEKPRRQGPEQSFMERSCLTAARQIAERRRLEEEQALNLSFTTAMDKAAPPPEAHVVRQNRQLWADPSGRITRELAHPTPWEKSEMKPLIEKRAGKKELTRWEVLQLAEDLARDGVEEVGRVLGNPKIFNPTDDEGSGTLGKGKSWTNVRAGALTQASSTKHPLEKIMLDNSASIPVSQVANWLLTLEWPRPDDNTLDMRIEKLYERAKRAEFAGDAATTASCRNAATRLEGAKTRKQEICLRPKDPPKSGDKPRVDVFKQSFLRPVREVDESTGRSGVKAVPEARTRTLGPAP